MGSSDDEAWSISLRSGRAPITASGRTTPFWEPDGDGTAVRSAEIGWLSTGTVISIRLSLGAAPSTSVDLGAAVVESRESAIGAGMPVASAVA